MLYFNLLFVLTDDDASLLCGTTVNTRCSALNWRFLEWTLVDGAAHTHIQLALQHSGHTHTSSSVRVHKCRTARLRLSMTSSVQQHESRPHTKTRSRSASVNPGLSMFLEWWWWWWECDEDPPGGLCSALGPVCVLQEKQQDQRTSLRPGGSSLDQQRIHIQQLTSQLHSNWTHGRIKQTNSRPSRGCSDDLRSDPRLEKS